MRYCSTRSEEFKDFTFEDALYSAFLPDGGLLLPEHIPKIEDTVLSGWSELSYIDLVKEVAALYIDESEIPRNDLNVMIERGFSRFTKRDTVPLIKLDDDTSILELFHGPTMSFKDLALSCFGEFLNYFLSKRKKHATIIVVEGSCEDADILMVECFLDKEFKDEHFLMSSNSINWARLMIQTVHWFYAYFRMTKSIGGNLEMVIPTGACGHITAGCIAGEMGLPITIVSVVNSNDIIARALKTGIYRKKPDVKLTLANAMDVQVPYNMQRLLYLFSDRNTDLVNSLLNDLDKTGQFTFPDFLLEKLKARIVSTFVADDDLIKETIKRCWQEYNYLICPHTAVAVAYYYHNKHRKLSSDKVVICATASPCKFPAVNKELGIHLEEPEIVKQLLVKRTRYDEMQKGDDWLQILKSKIIDVKAKAVSRKH